jgi:two-component system sensor histidine kinase DesK
MDESEERGMTEPAASGDDVPAPMPVSRPLERLFSPTSPYADRKALLASTGLSLLFSALMVPTWLSALSKLDERTARWSIGVGVAYAVAYMAFVLTGQLRGNRVRALLFGVTAVLGTALVALMGLGDSWVLMFVLCVVAAQARRTVATVVVLTAIAGVAIAGVATGTLVEVLPNLVILGSISALVGLLTWLFDTNEELRHARDRIAELAVSRERERFARDLHDLLGHSLTTITVKAGLVRRLLETAHDPALAVTEAKDVERLARQALVDVRAAVSASWTVTLSAELAAVGEVLRTAGIQARLPQAVDDVDPRLQQVFGHVLREAVTNVVRHSGADRVTVRLGRDWLLIVDEVNGSRARESGRVQGNGSRAGESCWAEGNDSGAGRSGWAEGNGLRGLRERMQAVGGTLEAAPRPGGGFAVRASAAWDEPPGGVHGPEDVNT